MTRWYLLLGAWMLSLTAMFAQVSTATLQGKVYSIETKEALSFASVTLFQNGVLRTGVTTDLDGNYSISALDPGTYDLEVSYTGFATQRTNGIKLGGGKTVVLNIELTEGVDLTEVEVKDYRIPLIEKDNTSQGKTIGAEDIKSLPSKNINGIIATTAGATSSDDGGSINIRGSRSDANDVYIDGIRVSGNSIPQSEIEQLQVVTGGIPANFGDATGGIVTITTKGPASKFSGTAELETSQGLDPYGYNLAMLALTGPILKDKNGSPIIGYRVSGQYRTRGDQSPTATGVYKLKDDVLADFKENPLVSLPQYENPVPRARFLTENDVELVNARPNSDEERVDLTGRLDFRLSKAVDFAIGGSMNTINERPVTNSLMNFDNVRTENTLQYRVFGRLRHRIMGNDSAASVVRNASYSLQFSYENNTFDRSDKLHGENLFNYGYIGVFEREPTPTFAFEFDGVNLIANHIGYNYQTVTGYTPSDINANLANYNKLVTDYSLRDDFFYYNGLYPNLVMDIYTANGNALHTNVSAIYNQVRKNGTEQYQFNASGAFDLLPKGSSDDKGKHSIEFGLMYEQRVQRYWAISPRALWQIGGQLMNKHFQGVDTANIIGTTTVNGITTNLYAPVVQDDVWAAIDPANRTSGQSYFDKSVRDRLGYDRLTWVNIDALKPSDLSLDMFSADELGEAGLVEYYGYDYLGNELGADVKFEDFFTATLNGEKYRPVAPNQPIYTAAYIQDKFSFKDVLFRVGLRVDRYDANTKVLKDDYSLLGTYEAGDFARSFNKDVPSAIGDDYTVYVQSLEGLNANNPVVTAYRFENQWYDQSGNASDVRFIFGGTQPIPALLNPLVTDIQNTNYDYTTAFKDADPRVSVMPRLAFSFPISDAANFFAHYDILTQRPPSNTIATALDYYYFRRKVTSTTDARIFNNPNLKPERTIDYEIGFQQKLSDRSALKMSAYYKELRDMIQAQQYLGAYPLTYEGFGNQDFGTVQGFSAEYDLRRVGNVRLVANYTLQFANGTGSDANSQRGTASRGNLRTLSPLSFDERHRFTFNFDFRYGAGKKYNGPMFAGKQIFANAGFNLLATGASGRPYTKSQTPQKFGGDGIDGGINQARLPWNVRLDLRVDKDFDLTSLVSKNEAAGSGSPLTMNLYLRVQNLLDMRNVLGVYSYSQSPDDDGFFSTQLGQLDLATVNPLEYDSYLLLYRIAMLNPGNYTLPRRIFVGALFQF